MILSGIYKIVNTITKMFYIGSAIDIHKRWDRHKSALNSNTHENIHLQRAWNKYGAENFSFKVVDLTIFLLEREQFYLDLLKPWDYTIGYNIGRQASGGDNLSSHPDREKIIEKITNTLKERVSKMSKEEKKRIWGRPGEKNPNWKGGVSKPSCIDCGLPISSKRTRCNVCSKQGTKNPFYGKKHSEEFKKRLSDKRKGQLPANTNPIILNGISYISQADAARQLGVSIGTISNWVHKKFKPRRASLLPGGDHSQST